MTRAAAPPAPRPVRPDPAPARALVPRRGPGTDAATAVGPAAPPRLRLLRYEPDADEPGAAPLPAGPPAAPVPDDLRETADLRRRAHQVLCLLVEVLDGRRPLAHLSAHLEPRPLRYVRAMLPHPAAARSTSRLTSLHVSRPRIDAIEVAAVRRAGGRARVLVARFEGRPEEQARWRCVTLRLL